MYLGVVTNWIIICLHCLWNFIICMCSNDTEMQLNSLHKSLLCPYVVVILGALATHELSCILESVTYFACRLCAVS